MKGTISFNVLNLVLIGKWYDMIASGQKKEEYREIKPYWQKRLLYCYKKTHCAGGSCQGCSDIPWLQSFKYYDAVRFSRGYTNETITFELNDITIGRGRKEWGAPDYETFILKLGQRLK